MTEREALNYKVDRAGWPSGPWDSEPDRIDFGHAGLPCLMLRNSGGYWCGYVAVEEGHPLFKADYEDADLDVHGGITFSGECRPPICHVPQPGKPDNVFWFGFDCAHLGDDHPREMAIYSKMPGYVHLDSGFHTYCDMSYVRKQVESLAEQLARWSDKITPSTSNPISE